LDMMASLNRLTQKIFHLTMGKSLIFLCMLGCSGCNPADRHADMIMSDGTDGYRTLESTTPSVLIQVEGRDDVEWILDPVAKPDVFSIVCEPEALTSVTYRSDIDELAFGAKGDDRFRFSILGPDGIETLQELRCLPPPKRYLGSYDPERDAAGVYPGDLDPIPETYFENDAPGVIVGVWQNEMPIYMRAKGLSNVSKNRKRLKHDLFEVASLAKEFTAVSIMQLIERDQLSLEDPVGRFFPNLTWGDRVTIRHLLAHTSGLGNRTYSASYTVNSPFDREEALNQLANTSLAFDPGTDYLYSNAGMTLLALIAEEVTGVSREVYLKKNVLGPAGMAETGFFWELSDHERDIFSAGYLVSAGDVTRMPSRMHPTASFGSGDLVSTLSDLRRWHVALKDGTLLSAGSFALMIEPVRLANGTVSQRGLAFMVGHVAGEKIVYNSGDIYTHTRHAFLADRDLSIIVNTNVDIDGNFDVGGRVRDQIIGKLMNSETMDLYGTIINVSEAY